MLYDAERGCTRDLGKSMQPENSWFALRFNEELLRWRSAKQKISYVPLEGDIGRVLDEKFKGQRIVRLEELTHPVFSGMTIYGIAKDEEKSTPELRLAYRCGFEKVIYVGAPEISESENLGFIEFKCLGCNSVMYSLEADPNRCKGF